MLDFKIQIGKRYVLRNGLVTGPIEHDGHVNFKYRAKVKEPQHKTPSVMCWLGNGRYLARTIENRLDIISEFKGD